MPIVEEVVHDVSHFFGDDCIAAETKGTNTLILVKLATPRKRVDGEKGEYHLTYWWHKTPPNGRDPREVGVLGDEYTVWTRAELEEMGVLKGNRKALFDAFYLT